MRTLDVVRMVALCVSYVATAKFGLSLDAVHSVATAVWPPTGIALMALVLGGCRLWPGITCGAFLVNLWAGTPVPVACGIALGNTLEALVGALLLQRLVGFSPALDRLRDVLGLIVLAAVLSTLVSATVGVTSGWLGGVIPAATLGKAWRTWWLGDAMGDLVVAPLLFVWSGRGRLARPLLWVAEAVAVCVTVGALSLLVFDGVASNLIDSPYILFPALIWAAVRLGPLGAITATGLVSAIAIWGTIQGFSPFASQTLHESLLALQAFLSVVAVTTLVLAAVVAERWKAETEVERRRRETEMLADLAQSLSASLDLDTVLQRVVAGAQELCASERAFIMLREPNSDVLIGRYEVGDPRMAYAGLRLEPGTGLGGQVLRTARPWRTDDYATDPRFGKEYVARARAEGRLAALAVPILTGTRVDGVFYVSNPSSHPFTDRDEELLVRLAVHAAIAIQNARLYRQAQEELTQRRQAEAHLTASLREKEVLLKEVHHRVKNNLQIVSSLLELQSDVIDDAALLAQFRDSQDRIRSMALIHETLYQSQDLARLDLARYIHTLSAQLMQSYTIDSRRITIRLQVEPVVLDIDQAIPCGLILNELLSNAFKYAFPQNRTGAVHVELHAATAQQAALVVRDNGVGLPDEIDFRHTESLGLQLVAMLTEQLQGTIALERADGTTFTLTFPVRYVEA